MRFCEWPPPTSRTTPPWSTASSPVVASVLSGAATVEALLVARVQVGPILADPQHIVTVPRCPCVDVVVLVVVQRALRHARAVKVDKDQRWRRGGGDGAAVVAAKAEEAKGEAAREEAATVAAAWEAATEATAVWTEVRVSCTAACRLG